MAKGSGTDRLSRPNGVWYYRRRVPLHLVKAFGKKVIQVSLQTGDLKLAKKRRTVRDIEWDASFQAFERQGAVAASGEPTLASASQLSEAELLQLVRDYVERIDQDLAKRL